MKSKNPIGDYKRVPNLTIDLLAQFIAYFYREAVLYDFYVASNLIKKFSKYRRANDEERKTIEKRLINYLRKFLPSATKKELLDFPKKIQIFPTLPKLNVPMIIHEFIITDKKLLKGHLKNEKYKITAIYNLAEETSEAYDGMFVGANNRDGILRLNPISDINDRKYLARLILYKEFSKVKEYVEYIYYQIEHLVHHELIHFLQFSTKEKIGFFNKFDRKNQFKIDTEEPEKKDFQEAEVDYHNKMAEYKPWLYSSLYKLVDHIKYEILEEKQNYPITPEQLLEISKAFKDMTGVNTPENPERTSSFFRILRLFNKNKWKKAVGDFYTMLQYELEVMEKNLDNQKRTT